MIEFLQQLQLSNEAIEIYINCLGKSPMTYYEIYSLTPNSTPEQFKNIIDELVNTSLVVKILPQKQEILPHFLAIPPFGPIINYYENINADTDKIKAAIKDLVLKSLSQIFKERKKIELNTIFKACQEIRKDLEEETLLQKHEVEDIVNGMETLKELNKSISDLRNNVKSVAQVQFASLIKIIPQIKNNLIVQLHALDLKKNEEEITNIIESLFKEGMHQLTNEFTSTLEELIQLEFDKIESPINSTVETTFQYRNDFKMLFLNMVNGFEMKIKKLYEQIKDQNDNLESNLLSLKDEIVGELNSIIQNSVNNVTALNKPIEDVLQKYLNDFVTPEKLKIDNLWFINSITKANEEIQNIIKTTKEEMILIVPKIENHLAIKLFNDNPRNLKIRIASSDPHVNSLVMKFKEIKNLEFRNLENENLIALLGDNNYFLIGLKVKTPKDPLDDFIGIGSNYKPLISVFSSMIRNKWNASKEEISRRGKVIKTRPITIKGLDSLKSSLKAIAQTPAHTTVSKNKADQNVEVDQKTPKDIIKAQPMVDNEVRILINNAFSKLLEKLGNFKGVEFSKELEIVAELILEKKGFSVTLHKIRRVINTYKTVKTLLTKDDQEQILLDVEEWKKHLL